VPYEKRHIKDSPRVDLHDELTPDEEATLFAHYGVDYEPLGRPESAPGEGPGPVPVDAGTAQEVEAVPEEPGTTEGPDPAPAEPETTDDPGPVPEEPGTTENSETAEGPETASGSPGIVDDSGIALDNRGSAEALTPAPMGSEGPPATMAREEEPGTASGEPGTAEGPGRDFPEAGTGGPDDATLTAPGGFEGPPDHPEDSPDRNLSRTAPVEPGLPGSTAASFGPVPTTVDKDGGDPDSPDTEEALRDQDEPQWAPAPAGSFDSRDHANRPAGSSDRWREAKLAAERERIARAAAAQPEERSPLERARRRLERLVGVGQDHPDDDISSSDRDEAERARRARLGFDEDDPRLR
jgi:hypothetical protein